MTQTHIISLTGQGTVNLNAQSIMVGGTTIDQKFKDYAIGKDTGCASTGGQYYLVGLNLVWNIPNAGAVSFVNLNGQLVAPNAAVSLTGGRHEGCVIAASVMTDSEAHCYPIEKLENKPGGGEEPGSEEETGSEEESSSEIKPSTEEEPSSETKPSSEESGSTSDREILEAIRMTPSTGERITTEKPHTAGTAVQTGDEAGVFWISGLALAALGSGIWMWKRK